MSLIAHYKLDGNTLDSSGNAIHGTVIGAPVLENGKINQAYTFRYTTSDGVSLPTNFAGLEKYSISVWVRPVGTHYHYNGTFISSGDWNATCWAFGVSQDNTQIDTAGASFNKWIPYTLPLNTWTHLVSVVESNTSKLYANGIYIGSRTVTGKLSSNASNTCIGRETYAGGYFGFNGSIDDVRVYNHALSVKEIKELAKGEVLHYTFDDFQEPTTNIFPYSHSSTVFTSAYNGSYGFGSATNLQQVVDNTLQLDEQSAVTKVSRINSGISQIAYVHIGLASPLNSIRTVSFWYYGTYGTSITPYNNDSSASLYYLDSNGIWQGGGTSVGIPVPVHSWYKVTLRIDNRGSLSGTGWDWLILHSSKTPATLSNSEYWAFTMWNYEEKVYATPFTPTSRTGKIMDNTGNGNDAILIEATTPRWINTSKIGSGCYYFDGTKSMSIPNFGYPATLSDPFSISIWINVPSSATWSNGYMGNIISRGSYTGSHGIIRSTTDNTIIAWMRGTTVVSRGGTITRDTWNHILMVNGGTSLQLYVNGSLTGTIAHSLVDTAGNTDVYIASARAFSGAAGNTYNGYLDDVRWFSTALTADDAQQLYQNRHTLDYNGNFFTPRLNETGHKSMYMDYTLWQDGQTGSVGMFSQNGSTTENYRVVSDDPWGKRTAVWEARPDATSGADGGWNRSSYIPIDNTKTHRISTWIRRTVLGNGYYYLGTNGGGAYVLTLAGAADSNPYFMASTLSTTEWRLYVGHVHPYGYTGSTHPDSGIYDVNGVKHGSATDYKCDAGTVSLNHRSYLYYSTDINTRQQWVYPRFDICDGTEPSIAELLAGFDSNNIDYIRTIGGTRNLSLDAGSSLSNVGKVSEVGITNGLVAYYPLDGNANDYSGNNKNLTTVTATYNGNGVIKGCYTFISTNVINGYGYDFPATTTISGWGYATEFGANMLFSFNSASYSGVDLYYKNSTICWNTGDGVANPFRNSGVNVAWPSLNTWHHYVVTNDPVSNKAILYLDGNYYGEAVYKSTEQTGRGFTIGNYYYGNNGYSWLGNIDEIRVYNRILSVEEIGILYEMGATDKKMKLTKDTMYIKGELKEGY